MKADHQQFDMEPLRLLDNFLEPLCSSIHVDIMPGEQDPTNYSLPQQPIHQSMFKKSNAFNSLQSVTNPYSFQIDGVGYFLTQHPF